MPYFCDLYLLDSKDKDEPDGKRFGEIYLRERPHINEMVEHKGKWYQIKMIYHKHDSNILILDIIPRVYRSKK